MPSRPALPFPRAIVLYLAAFVAAVAAAVALAPGHAAAQEGAPQPQAKAIVARAGIYVLNVGRLDTLSGSYTADFYLSFDCDAPCNPGDFEFMNGRATAVDKQLDTATRKLYRIQASYSTRVDLRSYPFDKHGLLIAFEDKHLSVGELVYQVDPESSGVDEQVIVSGWELVGWDARVRQHYYPNFQETYSRYEFFVEIRRGVLAAILKALLPALVIVFGGFLGFLLGPDKTLQRLTINTAALTGAILFHVNLTSQVPPAGSLTYADKFMIVNYLGLVGALSATVAMLILSEARHEALARRIHRVSRFAVPVLWAVFQAGVAATL